MYFDTHESPGMKKLVMALQLRYSINTLRRENDKHSLRLFIIILTWMCGFTITVIFFTSHTWVTWLLIVVFLGLVCISNRYRKQQINQKTDDKLGLWWQEIEELDADTDDCQLFRELVWAIESGRKLEVINAAYQALQSPRLLKLGFIRELRYYFLEDKL